MSKTQLLTKDLSVPLSVYDQLMVTKLKELFYEDVMTNISANKMTQDISIINTPINRGVILHARRMSTSINIWKALLRSSILSLLGHGYSLDHGYISTSSQENIHNTQYHIYIKPSLRLRAQIPVKQLFGNLFFDLSIENGKAIQWRLLSNVYNGFNYQEALTLQDLIQAMWGRK